MGSSDTLPLVFESGIFVFDEDGTLHVHLVHTPEDPHPMVTHPDGRETHIPSESGAVTVNGQGGRGEVRGHFPEVEDLPEAGWVLTLTHYDFVQMEGSGDVSVLIRDPLPLPDWFDFGKVHRFGRPGSPAPARWAGSTMSTSRPKADKAWTPPTAGPQVTTASSGPRGGGCLSLVVVALLVAFAGCPSPLEPILGALDDDDTAANDDDLADDDDSTANDDDSAATGDDDDSAAPGDDDDSAALGDDDEDSSATIGEICFPAINDPNAPGPDYDQWSPTVGSHCFGTNHQSISGVERVVFIGDSVTVGVPNFTVDLSSWGLPAGAGTPETAFYRNILSDMLAVQFGLDAPGAVWRLVDIINGVALQESDGDFASCAKWGARNDDILLPPQQQLEVCLPESERAKNTLVIMTSGGNDLANLTEGAIAGDTQVVLEAQATELVADLEDAVQWLKAPGRFPNGVHLIYGNMYEFTDGTGDTASCPAAALAGFGTPPPDPDMLADVVVGIQEEYMRIAVQNGVDMIWMLEHFCGHGWNNEDSNGRCYLGPSTPRWFDLSCTHPNEAGHQQLASMFMSVVNE